MASLPRQQSSSTALPQAQAQTPTGLRDAGEYLVQMDGVLQMLSEDLGQIGTGKPRWEDRPRTGGIPQRRTLLHRIDAPAIAADIVRKSGGRQSERNVHPGEYNTPGVREYAACPSTNLLAGCFPEIRRLPGVEPSADRRYSDANRGQSRAEFNRSWSSSTRTAAN